MMLLGVFAALVVVSWIAIVLATTWAQHVLDKEEDLLDQIARDLDPSSLKKDEDEEIW